MFLGLELWFHVCSQLHQNERHSVLNKTPLRLVLLGLQDVSVLWASASRVCVESVKSVWRWRNELVGLMEAGMMNPVRLCWELHRPDHRRNASHFTLRNPEWCEKNLLQVLWFQTPATKLDFKIEACSSGPRSHVDRRSFSLQQACLKTVSLTVTNWKNWRQRLLQPLQFHRQEVDLKQKPTVFKN